MMIDVDVFGGGEITQKAFTRVGVPSAHINIGFKPKRFVLFLYQTTYSNHFRAFYYDEDVSTNSVNIYYVDTNQYYTDVPFNTTNELAGISQTGGTWGIDLNYTSPNIWSNVWFYAEA